MDYYAGDYRTLPPQDLPHRPLPPNRHYSTGSTHLHSHQAPPSPTRTLIPNTPVSPAFPPYTDIPATPLTPHTATAPYHQHSPLGSAIAAAGGHNKDLHLSMANMAGSTTSSNKSIILSPPPLPKGGVNVTISLNHSPILFSQPSKGCELSGKMIIESDKVIKIKSMELKFIEHEYYEFGVPRHNRIPYVNWPLKYAMQLTPGSHHIPFAFLLPGNLHMTAFTKYNFSRYELEATVKVKGFKNVVVATRDLEFYPIPRLLVDPVASQPYTVPHELLKAHFGVVVPSPFVYANGSFQVEVKCQPRTPYFYLVKVEGKFIEMVEYTRTDGSIMYKDPDRTICEISDIQPTWRDPVPLIDDISVFFTVALPELSRTPPKSDWANATDPSVMPNPEKNPFVFYDVQNTHVTIKHGLTYKIELWDIRGAPQFVTNTVQIRVLPPLPPNSSLSSLSRRSSTNNQ
ncbi:hypothetical protein GQ54DRAFT_299182 [Martensiomyces pterosporus]|nr:hypothetical protein GQ54DRAFT_299182 [Martensiomyces pterosporus]